MPSNRKLWSARGVVWATASALALTLLVATSYRSLACPFCSAVSQTLSEEMAAMDTAAIARIVTGSETDADAEFEVVSVLRGDNLIHPEQKVRVNYFGKAKPEQQFLLMGVDPPDLLWSSPLPVSATAIEYIQSLTKLPKDRLERLAFFLPYLEHSESMLARDAYDEFAKTPYADLKTLKSQYDHAKLLEWIQDASLPPDRRRMYLVMLGICGDPSDADLLERLLRSDDDNQRGGLDAMIACYLTLRGAEGLPLVDELFLNNKKSQYADTYAAIMALRFHGTDGGVIEKERVLQSMRLILDRPELADLVIPDLARWEDWTQIDKLSELFKSADEKSSWVRVPVINYLRACPLAAAETRLNELKEIDPAAFKRATSFFPVPKASSGTTDSTYVPAAGPADKSVELALPPNRPLAASVISLASVTVWLAMWLTISGPSTPAWMAPAVRRWF
ncbi:MAG: hypothetical protein IT422_10470 [Pirellulaceae bacterium]|nr:hypothetical protein [Pirellulaceae bacterium]